MLGKIVKGKIDRPPRVLVYGEPGVGKSTFAAGWPSPLFIDAERRTDHLDIDRIEVQSWPEVLNVMREVAKGGTEYKTLVFDTVDFIEVLIYSHLCETENCDTIEDYGGGFGKGYTAAKKEWGRLVKGLEVLRDKGINCLLLAHGHVKTFRNPLGEDYDKWHLNMNQKSSIFLQGQMDAIGFAHFEDLAHAKTKHDKAKGRSTGERLLTFKHSAAHDSKQGIAVPDEVKLSYEAFNKGREGKE